MIVKEYFESMQQQLAGRREEIRKPLMIAEIFAGTARKRM